MGGERDLERRAPLVELQRLDGDLDTPGVDGPCGKPSGRLRGRLGAITTGPGEPDGHPAGRHDQHGYGDEDTGAHAGSFREDRDTWRSRLVASATATALTPRPATMKATRRSPRNAAAPESPASGARSATWWAQQATMPTAEAPAPPPVTAAARCAWRRRWRSSAMRATCTPNPATIGTSRYQSPRAWPARWSSPDAPPTTATYMPASNPPPSIPSRTLRALIGATSGGQTTIVPARARGASRLLPITLNVVFKIGRRAAS